MNWIKRVFTRHRRYDELSATIREHLDEKIADLTDRGMTREQAEQAARRDFGNVTRIEERGREVWQWPTLESIFADLRYTLRQLWRAPGFALTAIAVLALGIGASVAIFAFVDAALIRPLPYADPNRVMHVTESDAASPLVNLSYPDYLDWKRMNTVLSSLDVFTGAEALLSTPAGAEPAPAERVSAGFFRTLGVTPARGRDFYPSEEVTGGPGVVMLAYGTWQRRFGGRNDVIGKPVKLSGVAYTVIGVLPQTFEFALGDSPEFWMPLKPENRCDKQRDCHYMFGVGRLKDGVTVAAAQANLQAIAQQLEKQYPDTNRGRGASVMPLAQMIVGDVRPILLLLLSGAGLLLLIACVNVSSLLLVRTESRKRENAVRGALGASRARIARQFATESLVLTAAGVLTGLALAAGSVQILRDLLSKALMARMPYLEGLHLNGRVLLFAAALGLFSALLFALTPILHLRSAELHEGLSEGGRTAANTLWRRMGGRLVVIELATTMILLAGAGLLGKSLYRVLHVDVGFDTDHLATVRVRLPGSEFPGDPQQVAFTRRLLGRVEHLPGVQAAAVTSVLPVTCACNSDWIRIVGRPYDGVHLTVNEREVSPGFLTTLHARLLKGRFFTEDDNAGKPKVVVINRTFAQKYFSGEDPVGKRIGDQTLTADSIRQIVGVVDDFKDSALDDTQQATEYLPYNQSATSSFTLMVRTSQDEHTIESALDASIHALNMDVGVDAPSTMNEQIHGSQAAYLHRSAAYLVGGFALVALILSSVGLYGVIAFSVSRRTREIGVRMALGAQRAMVQSMVLREAGRLALLGIALGAIGSVAAGMLLRGMLFGVRAWDAPTLSAVTLLLMIVALASSFLPAHRAASVDPAEALRAE
jgi:macrolide transport system ATP-binding/permease protein